MELSAELREQHSWLSMAPNQAWFLAKQGNLEAQYVLGMCHLHGVQQEKSSKSAASWLAKAAAAGHVAAQFHIGLLWLEGKGVVRQDDTEAVKWLQKAAKEKHPEAMFNMGVLSLRGTGMPQSAREAANFFLQAAKLGNREAQFRYAAVLEYEVQKLRRQELEDARTGKRDVPAAEGDDGSEVESDDDAKDSDDDNFANEEADTALKLPPLRPDDVKGKVGTLLGHALHWLIKSASQNHGLAQHKAALLYMLGVKPENPQISDDGTTKWHTRPSVVTWGKSYLHSLQCAEARFFSKYPSVVTWALKYMKQEKNEEIGPNLEQAAVWHEKAANNGVLASAYAIAVAKETGQGVDVNLEESFSWYKVAATGQPAEAEGTMANVEYVCPHCRAWNKNQRTKETPKGNHRCSKCHEERYFPKDLLIRDPVANIDKGDSGEISEIKKQTSKGKDMSDLVNRKSYDLDASDRKTQGQMVKGKKVAGRAGANTASNDEELNEQLVYNVGGGSMIVITSDYGDQHREDATSAVGSRAVTAVSSKANDVSRPGSTHPIPEAPLIAGGGTMTATQIRNSIKITSLDFSATPKIMHTFGQVGRCCHVTVKNEATIDSGLFFVEFYLCHKQEEQELGEAAYKKVGKPVYGGRILCPNLQAKATAILSMEPSARCPLQVPVGHVRLWAGVRPWQAKDLPGANLTQLRTFAVQGDLVAMLHLADATYYGQAGVQQDVREAVRWYSCCKGTADKEGMDIASPVSVDLMVMMVGPLPLDLYPATLTRGYQPAWLALALNLDATGLGKTAVKLSSKFEREMVGDAFELVRDDGVPAMWMYHAAHEAKMAQAQLNLAIWYVHGRHVPRSLPQACFWFEQAANAGVADAQYNLGLLLQQGNGIPTDHKKAAVLYQKAVDQNHVEAHLSLGMCFLEGRGVEKDTEWAVKLLHVPANKGSAIAQFNLGCLYSRGLGVRKDDHMAVKWYIRAADQGHTEAQICYAMSLYSGIGCAQDFAHSAKLFEIAGESGHPQAQYNVGVMYAKGEGVATDREKAALWWEKASNQGHGNAQLELGQYYLVLARETVQIYHQTRVQKFAQIIRSKEYFEKFILLEKWQLGFGAGEDQGEMLMNSRLFQRILREFLLLIPEALSQEDVAEIMKKADKIRDEETQKNFGFDKFCMYLRGIAQVIGVDSAILETGVEQDPWEVAKREKKKLKIRKQQEKAFEKKVTQEMVQTGNVVSLLRDGKEPPQLRFDSAQNDSKKAQAACDELKAKISGYDARIKAQKLQRRDTLAQFRAHKDEADQMTTKKKAVEAGKANQKAERCRLAITKIEENIDKMNVIVDGYKTTLSKQERQLRKAQKVMSQVTNEKFDEDVGGFEIAMQKMFDGVQKEKEAFTAIRTEATVQKDKYIKCAAELFLEAAQSDVAEAQFRLGQLYKGNEPLPDSWIPQTEDEIEDKDKPGLDAYKKAAHELRLQEESARKNKMDLPFSFQEQVDQRATEMKRSTAIQYMHVASLSPKHAKLLQYLPAEMTPKKIKKRKKIVRLGDDIPLRRADEVGAIAGNVLMTPQTSQSSLNSSRASTAQKEKVLAPLNTFKFEVLAIEDYAEEDFLAWRDKRFRIERSAFWFKKGADTGYHEAKVELATMLKNGHEPGDNPRKRNYMPFPRNNEQAAHIFKEAALLNNARGQYEFAKMLLEGVGVERNPQEAADWLIKSAELDHIEAIHLLGICYENGFGRAEDKARAAQLYRQASERGFVDAMISYAMCLERGAGIAKDETAAFEWYRRAADKSPKALMLVGRCYQEGVGVPKNEGAAVETFLSASNTHDTAQLQLGISYQYGIGVRRNPEEAYKWYWRAAEAGNVEGMLNLAYLFAHGIGVQEDMQMYETWLRKAAAAGSDKAISLLQMYKGSF